MTSAAFGGPPAEAEGAEAAATFRRRQQQRTPSLFVAVGIKTPSYCNAQLAAPSSLAPPSGQPPTALLPLVLEQATRHRCSFWSELAVVALRRVLSTFL